MRLLLTILTFTVGLSPAARVEAAAKPDSLDALVETALARNPQLDAIEARVRALEHRTTRAKAWKDPRLVVAYQNVPIDSFSLGREPMSMAVLRLEQTIPFFGKTKKRGAVFSKAADDQRWALAERKVQLRGLVKRAYYQLGLARQLQQITAKHVELVEQLLDAVRVKYEVGRAPQHTVLRLQVLRDRLKDDLEVFDRQAKGLAAVLNEALHRDPGTAIRTPEEFLLPGPPANLDQLSDLAQAHRPALRQLEARATMHRLTGKLARSEATPDVTVFVGYGLRTDLPGDAQGRDLVTIGFSVPIPLFHDSNYGAQARESSALARAVDSDRAALTDEIRSGLADALASWHRAVSKAATYQDTLVPAAQRTLDATFSSYQVDRADFLSLYEAEVDLLTFERTIRRAAVEGLVAIANIETLVGKELP